MNNKLLKLARYLRQNGLYTEAAAVNAFKWEDNEPVGRATLSDVIPSTAPRSQKQKLIELLNAAEIVRKYKGKSLEEILEELGVSTNDPDYDEIMSRLKDLMDNPFYDPA